MIYINNFLASHNILQILIWVAKKGFFLRNYTATLPNLLEMSVEWCVIDYFPAALHPILGRQWGSGMGNDNWSVLSQRERVSPEPCI